MRTVRTVPAWIRCGNLRSVLGGDARVASGRTCPLPDDGTRSLWRPRQVMILQLEVADRKNEAICFASDFNDGRRRPKDGVA
jgi:hypothetical protein